MNRPAARLVQVSKSFTTGQSVVRALEDITLELLPGELTLIEGPSGSGKTTLLHILGLLQRPDTGQVFIADQRMDRLPESQLPDQRAKSVAFIFQGYNLIESLTAHDNVAVASRLGRASAASPHDLLGRLGLAQRVAHLPESLSGGEKQRVTIARALACPGQLVLADEPTANLDWDSALDVVHHLADLAHQQNRAVVMVSHDTRLEPFADRIVSLINGRIFGDHRQKADIMTTPTTSPPSPPPEPQPTPRNSPGLVVFLGLCVLVLLATLLAILVFDIRPSNMRTDELLLDSAPRVDDVTPYVAAAPAVVEPRSQLVALSSERPGRIKAVLKRAGERVSRGEAIVLLDDDVAKAHVEQQRAQLALAEANLAKLQAWHRSEQRAQARARVDLMQARLVRAEREWQRIERLHAQEAAPSSELNRALEDKQAATAELEEARQAAKIAEAGPTAEEVAVTKAQVAEARAGLQVAETELALRTITSPLDGHVIYRHLEPGEVVNPELPGPILSLGNLEEVRLRAEVDEADIERVKLGQAVTATAEAFGDREFTGRVVHLEPMMGRKTIRTERTTEQRDAKVREVLIELTGDTPPLPIDLQMTVRFLAG